MGSSSTRQARLQTVISHNQAFHSLSTANEDWLSPKSLKTRGFSAILYVHYRPQIADYIDMPSLDTKTIRHLIESIKTSPQTGEANHAAEPSTTPAFQGSGSELIRAILRRSKLPSQVAAKLVDEQMKSTSEVQNSLIIVVEDVSADPREAMEAVFIEAKTVSLVDRIRTYFKRAA